MQVQLAEIAARVEVIEEEEVMLRLRIGHQSEVVKPSLFSREASQVVDFVTACRLYIRMRMRDVEMNVKNESNRLNLFSFSFLFLFYF